MIKCSSNKKVYLTEDIAEEALVQTHSLFDFPTTSGTKGGGPISVYKCDDCGNYHLTSSGSMNEKLADYLKGGKPERDREADRWLRKLKSR